MSQNYPKIASKRGLLFEFWSFRPYFAQKWASRSSFARVKPSNLHEKPKPTRCTITRYIRMIQAFSKSAKWRRSLNHTQNTYDYEGSTKSSKKTPRTRILRFSAGKKTRAKSLLLLKNLLLIRISEILKEQNSNEKLIFDEKRASRSTFAPQKSIKIKKAESRARNLFLTENGAETRKGRFLTFFETFWSLKMDEKGRIYRPSEPDVT